MGRRGPVPRPAALLRLSGSFEKGKHGARERVPKGNGAASDLKPPLYFSDEHREVWHEVMSAAPYGVLTLSDAIVVETLVCSIVEMRTAHRQQMLTDRGRATPLIMRGRNGEPIQSPWVKIGRHARDQVARLSDLLALSPGSRARLAAGLSVAPPAETREDDGTDPWFSLSQHFEAMGREQRKSSKGN